MYLAVLKTKVVDVPEVIAKPAKKKTTLPDGYVIPAEPAIKGVKEEFHMIVAKQWLDDRRESLDYKLKHNENFSVYELVYDDRLVPKLVRIGV